MSITKEELRQMRKEAYKRAKASRDADPRYQELKEKIKNQRKALYQALKEKRKQAKEADKEKLRAKKEAELKKFFVTAEELEKK